MTTARRAECLRCLRPATACICHLVREVDNRTEVLILQHPLEQRQAKGTARLLHLCLHHSRLVVGERFETEQLKSLLGDGPTLLLYPETTQGAAKPGPLVETGSTAKPPRLVVIDGTWRKSRKMLAVNPLLQALPRLSWLEPPASRYLVRRAQRSHQLSSLEATALALEQLGDQPQHSLALCDAFDGLMAQLETQTGR